MRVALTSLCAALALGGCRFEADIDVDVDDRDDDPAPEAGPPTIYDLQQGLVAEGEAITVSDVIVTAVAPTGLFVQEREGGPYSGVFVYLGAHPDWHRDWSELYAPGDVVTISGIASEYAEEMDQFAIPTVTEIVAIAPDVVVTGHEVPPEPAPLNPFALFDPANTEAWEGVLVAVTFPFVLDHDIGYGEWLLEPGVVIGDWMTWFGPLYEGDRFEAVVGVVHFSYGEYKLEPRSYDDYLGYHSDVLRWHDLEPGDLVLTEVMLDPTACEAERAQYVELVNVSGETIDLAGVTLLVGGQQFRLGERQLLGDGGIVLGAPTTADRCYAVKPHFDYGFAFDPVGETFAIAAGSTIVDVVDMRGWPTIPTGASLSLDPNRWNADDNDKIQAWCAAGTDDAELIGTDGSDQGSPGYPNTTRCR